MRSVNTGAQHVRHLVVVVALARGVAHRSKAMETSQLDMLYTAEASRRRMEAIGALLLCLMWGGVGSGPTCEVCGPPLTLHKTGYIKAPEVVKHYILHEMLRSFSW